ncbi:MAG TPA: class I SAM-dependent methyltransferase [Acidimicrobiales bacterium]|nr:class I SAM-dependent methyltransferase [Acidimicrobiales bacterium]
MTVDHYAGVARGWAEGATLVYGPIVRMLVATSPHALAGRVVLDLGSGTGIADGPLAEAGATSLAVDLSADMLRWNAPARPAGVVADVRRLPLSDRRVDDVVAAFVFNHLTDPERALAEAARVTRRGGAVLACVYANSSRSAVRDALDDAAREHGWVVPDWYVALKEQATPILGTVADMAAAAVAAGLHPVATEERAVDVGVTTAEQMVGYRLGQAQFAGWVNAMGAVRAREVKAALADRIRLVMEPFRPAVVFLASLVPAA